jgi:hopanoid biosynthesis associated RND transporter like protein HpnN
MQAEPVRAEEATIIHRLLVGLVTHVCRYPRLVLTAALALCALSAYAFCTRLEYRTQRNDLLSPDKAYQQRWRDYLAEFGNDDDMVVVLQGSDRARLRDALEGLADGIRGEPGLFDRLFYKADLRSLRNRALLFLPADQLRQIQGNLQNMSPLLEIGPLAWQLFTLDRLVREASDRARNLEPGQPLGPDDQQFLAQLLAISKSATATLDDPNRYYNPWRSMVNQPAGQQDLLAEPQYFFSGDGKANKIELAFLLVRPVKEEGSFTSAQKSVAALRELVARVRSNYPELEMGLTGLPVLENDEMTAAQHDTQLASWLAIAGVGLLFILVYRGVAYPLLTMGTLLVGTAWAMGWLTLTVGHLNILSATFAVMLVGMGDYGVLWVMRYEHARRLGMDVASALRHTAAHVAVGNLTAATTLALAFFAAIFADFQAVAELGWIAGCGVLLCALACFTFLPALLILCDRRTNLAAVSIPITTQAAWLPSISRRPWLVIGTGLAVTVLLGVCASRVTYDHNLLHLQAEDLDGVKWELKLIEHTAGASWHSLSYTATAEEALALKARYEKLPGVSRVVEVASLVPADQETKVEQLRDIQYRLRNLPRRGAIIPHFLSSAGDLQKELAHLGERLEPLASGSTVPLLADLCGQVALLRKHLAALPDDMANQRLCQFEQRLTGDLAEDLHHLREVATPATITLADLPPELRERYVGRSGKWLLRVFAKDCLWDFRPLEDFTREIAQVDPQATGKPFSTVEGLKSMKNGFQRAGLYAFLVIAAVLLVDFRSLKNTLIALTPLVMGVLLSLGIMGLFGLPLNPANMIAFPLILGVGVDNGVHVLHDYLLRRAEGRTTISYAIGRGVLVKALTAMIGFGTLMISTERGLVGLGFILTLGVGCCMLASLVFLPAVLQVLDRRTVARVREKNDGEPLAA